MTFETRGGAEPEVEVLERHFARQIGAALPAATETTTAPPGGDQHDRHDAGGIHLRIDQHEYQFLSHQLAKS